MCKRKQTLQAGIYIAGVIAMVVFMTATTAQLFVIATEFIDESTVGSFDATFTNFFIPLLRLGTIITVFILGVGLIYKTMFYIIYRLEDT